ncbi:benzoyl-CoA reductase, bzd-type, subunit N [bacterium]|nr:benzoyl-CoA reductase, bzd-type, subunit N [bacterium]MBU1025611.1 benzoyl-CoA reductase, bzd-type, subunit N [bacterium]
MFDKFKDWKDNRHDYAKAWRERTGGKVLGYFCTYVPEEILHAANILPVRILGSHEPQDVTEPHIFGMFCPFCRDCLAQGLKGRFDYLDGIMISQSCLHIRQTYTSWEKHIPVDFSYYLPMPQRVQSPRALPYFTTELETFKKAVEDWTGKEITDDALDSAISDYNESRKLHHEVYNMRKQDTPPLTGEEAMLMVVSSQMTDKREHNEELKKVIAQLKTRTLERETGARLIILGSEDDDIEFIHMVESCGATFVTDDHCTGTRYFWNEVEPSENRLQSIAKRYIERVACPSKDWEKRTRLKHILKLVDDWNVKGAIVIQQKFCDPHELDMPAIRKALNEHGIKSLFLEFDVTVPVGQFKVRAEAFLEMIGDDDLF